MSATSFFALFKEDVKEEFHIFCERLVNFLLFTNHCALPSPGMLYICLSHFLNTIYWCDDWNVCKNCADLPSHPIFFTRGNSRFPQFAYCWLAALLGGRLTEKWMISTPVEMLCLLKTLSRVMNHWPRSISRHLEVKHLYAFVTSIFIASLRAFSKLYTRTQYYNMELKKR